MSSGYVKMDLEHMDRGKISYTKNGNPNATTTETAASIHHNAHQRVTASSPHTATPTVTMVEKPIGNVPMKRACDASASMVFHR